MKTVKIVLAVSSVILIALVILYFVKFKSSNEEKPVSVREQYQMEYDTKENTK